MQKETEVEHAVAAARDEAARHAERQADALRQEMGEAKERQIRDLTAFWSDEVRYCTTSITILIIILGSIPSLYTLDIVMPQRSGDLIILKTCFHDSVFRNRLR